MKSRISALSLKLREIVFLGILISLSFYPFQKLSANTPPLTNLAARYVAGVGITSDGGSPDKISLWADQSGNYDLSQITPSKQPYNTVDLNGDAVVRFPYDYPTHPQVSMVNADIQLNNRNSSIFVIRSTYHTAQETLVTYTSWSSILGTYVTDPVQRPSLRLSARSFTDLHPPLNKTLTGGVLSSSGYIGYTINASSTLSAITNVDITGITIGANAAGTGELFTGDIYEILIYNSAVDQATVDAIRAYAIAEYGIQASFSKQVVMVGDSNTEGNEIVLGEENYPRQAYPDDWQAFNNGVGATTLYSTWFGKGIATSTDLIYDSSLSRNVMVVMLGTNDINSHGKSASETFSVLNSFIADRQNVGWEVWVMTIPPLNSTPEITRDAYNNLIIDPDNYTNPPDGIIDYTSDPRIGDTIDNDYGAGDNLHFNADGAKVVAQYVYRILNNNIGPVSYSITGDPSGLPDEEVTLTLTSSGGTFLGEIITPSDGGAGGTFTPSTITTTIGGTLATVGYSRPSEGSSIITFTNDGLLNNPVNFSFSALAPTYSVSGTISGLSGTVILRNNGGDDLSISSNGAFTFDTELEEDDAYSVTVSTQPEDQTCYVINGSGTVSSSDITNISVTCTDDEEESEPISSQFSKTTSASGQIQNLINSNDIQRAIGLIRQQIASLMVQLIALLQSEVQRSSL